MQKVDDINSKYEASINHFTARLRAILANKTTILISKYTTSWDDLREVS